MTVRRLIAALACAGFVAAVWAVLPPRARRLTLDPDPRTVRGAFHVHTKRSDGTGTPEAVADAAARAGLDFVVLTDHGDATRMPEPPRYVHGVLLLDAVEISTTGGHYVALGLGQAPYRLAGEPRDVVEDVHRLGGFGIAAHPDSPKAELRWREWQAPFDGIEWLSADSQWRDEPRHTLARAFLTYWLRGPETIASLFDRPELTLARWDAAARRRRVVGLAGLDAHARLPLSGQADAGEGGRSLPLPSYDAAFRTLAVRVTLDAPPGRTAASAPDDAARLLRAVREGAVYTVVDAIAGPAALDTIAEGTVSEADMGGENADSGPIRITARYRPVVPGATLVLVENGVDRAAIRDGELSVVHDAGDGPAVYRAEVRMDGAPGTPPVPWIVGNPVYVTRGQPRSTVPIPRPLAGETGLYPASTEGWSIERHPQSDGAVTPTTDPDGQPALAFTWRLAPGPRRGQYAALVHPIDGSALRGKNQLEIVASASRPMRASIQIRVPSGEGLRWARSIYLDPTPRQVIVPLREMTPIEPPPGAPVDLAHADSWLLVVDTVNTVPGASGRILIRKVAWGSGDPGMQAVRPPATSSP